MERKTKQIVSTIFITGVMFFFYSIYSIFFADLITMTDEQYAHEAQKIVSDSLVPCQSPVDTGNDNQKKLTCNK